MIAARGVVAAVLGILVATLLAACGSTTAPEASAVAVASTPTTTTTTTTTTVDTGKPTLKPRPRGHHFSFKSQVLPARIKRRVTGSSWHEGCPVTLGQLRYLQMNYWGFDGKVHGGVMVVNATAVAAVRTAFRHLFAKRFPIRRMRLVDDYGADDYTSIEADNTSSFNCRRATGSSSWSEHAYGRAIDIDPIENPYVYSNGTTTHPASQPYLDRSRKRPGMAREGGALVSAFDAVGWGWGGRWTPATDLQHFSASGR